MENSQPATANEPNRCTDSQAPERGPQRWVGNAWLMGFLALVAMGCNMKLDEAQIHGPAVSVLQIDYRRVDSSDFALKINGVETAKHDVEQQLDPGLNIIDLSSGTLKVAARLCREHEGSCKTVDFPYAFEPHRGATYVLQLNLTHPDADGAGGAGGEGSAGDDGGSSGHEGEGGAGGIMAPHPDDKGGCPPGGVFIKKPLKNLANGYGIQFALAEGETKFFCAEVDAPRVPASEQIKELTFIWNDVADYECNEVEVTVTQSFSPGIQRGPSTGPSGALRFAKTSGFGDWRTTCDACTKKGIYVVRMTGKKIWTPSDPACHHQTLAWSWR